MSINLHTGFDYFMALPIDELNDIAADLVELSEEVKKRGNK